MEYALVGWPDDDPQLRLDHREFSYAGKFVMSNTGKAVAREENVGKEGEGDERNEDDEREDEGGERNEGELIAAIAFNEDRTDSATAWLRYVTVRRDRRGEGIGAKLAHFASDRLEARGYDRVKIAVNNPFAYHALHKAGFGYTGERTGIAELVLERPGERTREAYQSGLDAYRERDDLAAEELEFLGAKEQMGPPDVISEPK